MTTRICTRTGAKWAMPRYKTDWRHICAILPAYLEDGTNGTKIIYLDGSEESVSYRLQWVLDDLLLHLGTSSAVLTKQSRAYLGRNAKRVPLLASREFCLVPVKGREPISEYDRVSGYIVLQHVSDVIPCGKENCVYFTNRQYLTVYDSTRKIWENLNLTKEMKQNLEGELQCLSTPLHCPVA